MGICTSDLNDQVSRQIDKKNEEERVKQKQISKLLLLGAGESGKSTLFKQIFQIYGEGFTDEDRMSYRRPIHNNTLVSMVSLVKEAKSDGDDLQPGNEKHRQVILDVDAPGDSELDADLGASIAELWTDPAVQRAMQHRGKLQLADNIEHFFDNVAEIAKPKYCPSYDDILRSRVRTTGIIESDLSIQNNMFRVIDVGGQRNERSKWIHCFEEVTGVIFVAALNEYDQEMFEAKGINRMHEALELFGEISNSQWFFDTSMILFLNKKDLFREKIKTVPLTVWNPNYDGKPNDYDQGCEFLIREFESRNTHHKQVYTHVCCALDEQNVRHLIIAVKDIVLRRTLNELHLD